MEVVDLRRNKVVHVQAASDDSAGHCVFNCKLWFAVQLHRTNCL
jgi:hypothetical protein